MTAVLLLLHLVVNIKFQIVDKEDWRAIFAPPTSADAEKLAKFGGIVEVDETYIGCKAINKHGDRSGTIGGIRGKTPIIGAVSRKGNVVTRVLDRITKASVEAFIREAVSDQVSLLATDQNRAYDDLVKYGFKHGVSITARSNTSSAQSPRTRLKASGRYSSAGSSATSIRSARNTCRCASRSFSSATQPGQSRYLRGGRSRMLRHKHRRLSQLGQKASGKPKQLQLPLSGR
jgi:hypothetical protein